MDRTGDAPADWTSAAEPAAARRFSLVQPLVAQLRHGRLRMRLPNGHTVASSDDETGLQAVVSVERWRMFRRVAFGGAVGFAESYIAGDWTSPDPVALLRLMARNADDVRDVLPGASVVRLANRIRHTLRGNTRRGSRRNIMSHYDLGNAFYALWLDRAMQYSSALWEGDANDLEAAQEAKLARIVEMMGVKGGERVLEIGFGWGSLALRLAAAGARVAALTLSPSQLAFARARAEDEGQAVDFRLQDYRDVSGRFDRIVSIEMIEAVGEARLPLYFRTLARSLEAKGRAVLQAITIDESLEIHYRRDPDFIQAHIFPGGFLPTRSALRTLAENAGLKIVETQQFGASYARTLSEWRRRFHAHWPEVEKLGFDARFRRLWDYYLAYCEAGFAEGTIDVGLVALEPA